MGKTPLAIAAALCIAAAGCWPWHHEETPQQRFIAALNHGHSAEASQIWLRMSPEDKVKFAQSQGMQPGSNPDEVKKLVLQHYEDKAEGAEGAQDVGGGEETIETPNIGVGGAGLQNLPGLAPQGAAPAPASGN